MNVLRFLQVLSALLGFAGLIQTAYYGNLAPSLVIIAILLFVGIIAASFAPQEGTEFWAGSTSLLLTAFAIAIFVSSFYFRTDEESHSPIWIVDGEVEVRGVWAVPLLNTVRRFDPAPSGSRDVYVAKASRHGREYELTIGPARLTAGTFGHDTLMAMNTSEKIDVGPMLRHRYVDEMDRAFSREIGKLPDPDFLDGDQCVAVFRGVKDALANEAGKLGFADSALRITRKFGPNTNEADPCLLVRQELDRQYEEKWPSKLLKK